MKKNDRRFGLSKRQYRKLTQAIRHLLYQLRLWIRRRLAPLGRGGRQLQFGRRGFVLPTAVIVLVVLTLTVAALMIRTLNRTAEVGGQRQTIQVLNATAPAIDRARAKLEYFFNQDPLRPNGVPGEETIEQIIGNRLETTRNPDPYTMADEQRIDINGDGQVDNAWVFQPTSDSIVAYSILMRRPSNAQLDQSDAQKAGQLITRSRPMGITELGNQCSDLGGAAGQQVEVGWDEVGSAILRKNFQINAFVYENRNGGQALSTIEFVQERQMERGNKWGAWFRNDLEIFPGPEFRWNGALHTEGSVFLTGGTGFTAYLISAPKSCVYTRAASEITATEIRNPETNEIEFQGQFMAGSLRDNNTNAPNVYIHSYREPPSAPYTSGDANPPAENVRFNASRDSVKNDFVPANVALNPVAIVTEDRSRARGSDPTNVTVRDPNWSNQFYVQQGRFDNKTQPKPYVDDTYRADDRYGPKPVYDVKMPASDPLRQIPPGAKVGDPIEGRDLLTRNVAPSDSQNKREDLGLDGYWERRARQEGLRIIVGERLELGKPLDRPADPPAGNTASNNRRNEFYQHRTLRDDLAAVQATAIYHYKARGTTVDSTIPDPFTEPYPGQNTGGYEPIACLATTHHHGTPQTALRSIMFNQYDGIQGLPFDFRFFDFFTGRGTNGWEFQPPDFNSPEMRKAMRNLVAYAGDGVDGAFPPKQEIGGTTIHPDPNQTRAGNFSNLDRALQLLEQRGSLSALSLADQSTIHTAGCMLGMLAYSVNTLQTLDVNSLNAGNQLVNLNNRINDLNDNDFNNGEVIPRINAEIGAGTVQVIRQGFSADQSLSYRGGYLDANAYITALIPNARWSQRPLQETNADVNARLARLIALTEQVKYDLNPQQYTCGIPDEPQYSNLRKAFCLGQDKRGFVIGQEFEMPGAGERVRVNLEDAVKLEDAPSYNFDLGDSDKNKVVYVTGAGWMILEEFNRDRDDHGKILTVTLKNPGPAEGFPDGVPGNAPPEPGRKIPAGASASISNFDSMEFRNTRTGTISVAVPFPNDPSNSTTVEIQYTLTSQLQVGDIVEIRRPINRTDPNSGRLEGRFKVIDSPAPLTAKLRYIGGTERTGTGTTPIAVNSTLVVLKRQGDSDLPLGTFNTVIKYPALRAIFNPSEEKHVTRSEIAANPRMNPTNFLTPTEPATGTLVSNIRYPSRLNQIIGFDGNARNVAFLDNTLFNGREEMAVREMDIDLDLLRRRTIGGDTWLPMGGIVYAFREDAVREDGIARPAITGQNWMNTNPSNPHDPIRAANGISTKPVDFFADPMRRPNGFRLWNGKRLDREGIPASKNIAGLSFISDNPVYIQGDFNLHSTNGTTNNLEEFTTTLDANWSNFYSRNTLDNRFARPNSDTWRPAEILGDAVTILSDNFCNGSANDYFAQAYNDDIQRLGNNSPENLATNYVQNTGSDARVNNGNNLGQIYLTCANNANLRTSFLNANRPSQDLPKNPPDQDPRNDTVWLRESPFDPSSPIYVDRNGTPWAINYRTGERVDRDGDALTSYPDGEHGQAQADEPYNSNSYYRFSDPRSRNSAKDTQVNAVIISGTVPSRPTQSYGGMHNFPRFLEGWGNLTIQGSFIQLNFSTQATGPFDQDQWEIPNDPRCRDVNTAFNCPAQSVELIQYYGAPTRRWGYDVGLQLAPAGPVARRFITPGRQRNEFYTELRADDPYILRLRCAQRPDGSGRVDPTVSNCSA
ncbi:MULTISPECIES: hormogonium polysaccharide biosynthesis protein HpsA [unclassified Thermosynechococcus]|uniref:hormogonium polysaccharide biosynthesis protein HpsA n=1 Tax=unclassified Thermosynechococcus TaxID=2622553 RepID=UPI0028733A29|nr:MULTISPECIES: hormogonium polysaccharide biosynthesis protein HpsA [unclassified Thermosynechococcus]WNC31493.1 hormogonium polysaccharide biosynthesis protein HpsA [Thermosynechococcus sp. PKX95]WNC34017.1 hormogonium polysaccharide biosynthesis protein HpsA [Thermosynechococcus sp. PKX91]WNC36541.1 hormogonium polysaccharide biosynthesis protein HpsA [Thermosynechococcus sp. WL11]WNC39062.1 hormogonium polysaccharide biosynthesis protein HpsA [Thermosynechococcus sp. WL17]WNC41584.1 hormo